jgi:hypothetical protein
LGRRQLETLVPLETTRRKRVWSFRSRTNGGHSRRLTKDEEARAPPYTAARDRSGRWAVYSFEGDIHLLDTHSGKFRKVTQTAEAETEPSFTRDEKKISFRRGDNLFLIPREGDPLIRQLTDIRSGKDPEVEKEKKERGPTKVSQRPAGRVIRGSSGEGKEAAGR